jgi:hypothetical protein
MKALALLSNLRSADVVLPTTDSGEVRLRRITKPDAGQASSTNSVFQKHLKSLSTCSADSEPD